MKRASVIGAICAVCLWTGLAGAQEPEGLIPKLINKWKNRGKAVPQAPAAGVSAVKTSATLAAPAKAASPIGQPSAYVPTAPSTVSAAAPARQAPGTEIVGIDKMSREELLADIREELDADTEILDYIPELKRSGEKDGRGLYTYAVDGVATPIEELKEELLRSVLSRVNQTGTKLRVDRLNEQLAAIRQVQQIQDMQRARMSTQPPVVTAPAPVPVAPQAASALPATRPPVTPAIPARPPQPVSVPKTPPPPPQLPRR